MVVRGSACEAASWTSRSGTPASRAAVMNACRSVCGPTGLVIPARTATRRTIRAAPCRSSRCPADVGGRGVVEQVFLHCVLVEPGDGAQPPGDGGPGPAAGLQVAGETLDVGAAGLEQAQVVLVAPAHILAQVQLVRLAGQAAVAG